MGYYSEYLDRKLTFAEITAERKAQLKKISEARGGRDILVFAADLSKGRAPISITYEDLLAFKDQLSNLRGSAVDLILETPGGSGEVAEDIVRLLHSSDREVAVIVPGWAKSAGTIIAMAGDEILMDDASGLGPIDAQITWQGKVFSADALLEGFEKIKKEVLDTGNLNRAYIPILQGISPGELQNAENALMFARRLVTDWLVTYKFKRWNQHASTGAPVTPAEKRERAEQIAKQLCDHKRWLTHGRSIKRSDLEEMRLKITDYSKDGALAEAIGRYHTLLQMTFATNIYKVFETAQSQVYRFLVAEAQAAQGLQQADVAVVGVKCARCGREHNLQANLGAKRPLQAGHHPFPTDNIFRCSNCGAEIDLTDTRRQLEAQTKRPIVT